ncbi:MAG: family 43 glycosylhydrolase, partial [Bacteroidota bacterium]
KDTPNYLVMTEDILGDWSDPIFLSSSGFDGSLFHDASGRKYYLSMLVDHRKGKFFGGVTMQEYSVKKQCLIGEAKHFFPGTELGLTEGPHLYQRNGYYYLITAEGGTEYNHAVTVARSCYLEGPYEVHPENPLLSARDAPAAPLQKTGHADMVESASGAWYLVCLTGRPLTERGRCILGRETLLEELVWEDDWPKLKTGGRLARTNITPLPAPAPAASPAETGFGTNQLSIHFQALRRPLTDDWCSWQGPGRIKLKGQESLSSLHQQSLVARRLQAFATVTSVSLDFQPQHFQHLAGLVAYYNTYHWLYCYCTGDDAGGRLLQVLVCDKYQITEQLLEPVPLPEEGTLHLRAVWRGAHLQFSYRAAEAENWILVGPELDASILSDDYVQDANNRYRPAFTGAFIGVCCQDLRGTSYSAQFFNWSYQEG